VGAVPDLDSYRNRAVLRGAVGNRDGFYEITNGSKNEQQRRISKHERQD